ncbi:MAG: T9SS type A sorting domain-containing protein [Bacteroidetes bacterium]|nr:T9SS type A sorting domain-containing protein [Bacteroidota bacterium]
MKTFVHFKKISFRYALLLICFLDSVLAVNAQSGGSNLLSDGLKFSNPLLQSGTDLHTGANYLFQNVAAGVDAVVSIDSLINGAKVTSIDDNTPGTGYLNALQPSVQSGNIIGNSYAVFTVKFYNAGTNQPVNLQTVNATALDIDGNLTLKEFAQISMGSGAQATYMSTTSDISLLQVLLGNFKALNIAGIERTGIDTSSYANMFTVSNSGISSFSIKYGTSTLVRTTAVRQFSLYMKGFQYPDQITLPVKLVSFSALLNKQNVDLKWVTSEERNASHFEIEKSYDGINYSEAGLVFAFGNTNQNTTYTFSDNVSAVQNGVLYYRLRSVDMDGKSQLSEVRVIRLGKQIETATILTYPNPVNNELRVTIPSQWQNKPVLFEIYNANGQKVKQLQNNSASQTESFSVSDLGRGLYIVNVVCGSDKAQQKIIKN